MLLDATGRTGRTRTMATRIAICKLELYELDATGRTGRTRTIPNATGRAGRTMGKLLDELDELELWPLESQYE